MKTLLGDPDPADVITLGADNPELYQPDWLPVPKQIARLRTAAELLTRPNLVRIFRAADGRGKLLAHDLPLTPLAEHDPAWPQYPNPTRQTSCASCGASQSEYSVPGLRGPLCQGCVTAATEMLRAIDARRAAEAADPMGTAPTTATP
jgi:hypothetical protein